MESIYRGPSGKGPRIVAIGGGTGLSTMLRGLKGHTNNLTAIVTVADDGGGSGVLRQELGMLPPGKWRHLEPKEVRTLVQASKVEKKIAADYIKKGRR